MLTKTGKRITAKVSDHHLDQLQMAADMVGATVNQFVIQAATEKADMLIKQESTISLSRRESLRILELIENPPPRNEKFNQAVERYQKLKS